jgi:DNA excision repair protein ERCC-2
MKFLIENLVVYWPYDRVYPEQYQYMTKLKQTLDAKGNCLLEMPTGTGKTVSLLALITSYQLQWPKKVGKLIYCTRTVPEMTKAMVELKRVIRARNTELRAEQQAANNITAVCLSSRRNMCIHEDVIGHADTERVDSACRKLTAPFVRADENQPHCDYFETFDREGSDFTLGPSSTNPTPIYTLEDLQKFGKAKRWCPYFVARHAISYANVVIFNYQYMLDPKVSNMVTKELDGKSIVVFDEAHNIDSVCVEAYSININRKKLDRASANITKLTKRVSQVKQKDKERLENEFQRLVSGLQASGAIASSSSSSSSFSSSSSSSSSSSPSSSFGIPANLLAEPMLPDLLGAPVLPEQLIAEAIPGNIRRAEHFLTFMQDLVKHLKKCLKTNSVVSFKPLHFLTKLREDTGQSPKTLKFTYSRLNSLMKTLEILDMEEYTPLQLVADFATLISTHTEGFIVIIEPYSSQMENYHDPILQLACLDASIAIKHVFERFQTVVITSGTLSPIDLYPKLLGFQPAVRESLQMSVTRNPILPMIVSRGTDQAVMSSAYDKRDSPDVVRNYGDLLISIANVVPDGIICFFTSYDYMERTIATWDRTGLISTLLKTKLIFIETKDIVETTLALASYKKACDCGRGAIFFSIARGKVAEGIDFAQHYGRCVLMMGIPYQYTKAKVLLARLDYLRRKHDIHENDFLTFDALRQTSQCIGRVIRSKTDYGIIILADERYAKPSKKNKLPPWVTKFFQTDTISISTDTAVHHSRNFLMKSAQPITTEEMTDSLLDKEKLDQLHEKWIRANPGASIVREGFDLHQRLKRERAQRDHNSSNGDGNGRTDTELHNEQLEFERNQQDLEKMQRKAEEERLEQQFSWDRMPKELKLLGQLVELNLHVDSFGTDRDGDIEMGDVSEKGSTGNSTGRIFNIDSMHSSRSSSGGPQTKRARLH